jgi:hypothetical protein
MSDYGNNINYLDIISNNDINTLCEYYKQSFIFTDTFNNLKNILMSKSYMILINKICGILQLNTKYSRIIGLLCLIKYKPNDFNSSFNYNNYTDYIKSLKRYENNNLDDLNIDNQLNKLKNHLTMIDNINNKLSLDEAFYIVYNLAYYVIKITGIFVNINKDVNIYETNKKLGILIVTEYDKTRVNEIYSLLKLYMSKYITYFNLWKEEDRKIEITRLIQSYWEIEITKKQVNDSNKYSSQQKTDSLNELTLNQQQLKGYLKQIGGDEALNDLSLSIPVVIDDSLLNHIRNNLELVYWENIEKDILTNDYTKLKSVLEDFKTTLLKINKNKDFTRDVNDVLDVDFFINRLENNAVELSEGLQFNHIFNKWLLMLDAPIHDELNKSIKLDIDKQLQEITMLITTTARTDNTVSRTDNTVSRTDNTVSRTDNTVSRTDKLKCICKCLSVLINVYYTKFKGILEVKNEILNSVHNI